MKKHILLVALAAATSLMTSCSSDEELSSTDSLTSNTIAFSTNNRDGKANTPQSRSGETVTSLNKFYVTALNPDNSVFFDSETFNYSGGVFQSSTAHYWPTSGTLSFYAINEEGTKASDANNVPNYTFTDWEGETDLVAATAIAGEKQMPYPLTFKHLTSQVIIGAEAEDKTEELTYKLISVTMTAPSTGTYSFDTVTGGTGTWSIDNTKTTEYSYADALPMSFAQSATNKLDNCYWNILPTTDGKLYFKVQYQVYQNGKLITDYTGDKYKECTVENPNLQSGKIYTYNFLLSRSTNDVITFTTTISDWEDDGSTDETIYDPALTYVKYKDGTMKSYDISGDLCNETSTIYVTPTTMVDDAKNAVYVKVGNKVTSIGYKAFAGCQSLAKIDIPSSVKSLGEYAFAQCDALTEIVLPEGLTTIADNCFHYTNGYNYGAASLSKVVFPSTLTSIGEYAFCGCYSLTHIDLPENLTEISDFAFSETDLTSIELGDNIKKIGQHAFGGCNYLTTATIPANCTIGTNAFRQNISRNPISGTRKDAVTSLTSVKFKGKVTFDGYAVFWGCTGLTSIEYNSLEAPEFTSNVGTTYNAWTSTSATNACGNPTAAAGTNMFYVPKDATYTESDIDKNASVLFNSEKSGFTLSKTL